MNKNAKPIHFIVISMLVQKQVATKATLYAVGFHV